MDGHTTLVLSRRVNLNPFTSSVPWLCLRRAYDLPDVAAATARSDEKMENLMLATNCMSDL